MNINNTVSVIIPFYSGESWLEEAVQSVINQTYPIHEIIVINDGSNENVDSFLKKYSDRVNYIYKENGGPATARNIGITLATGEYVAFLDSDDLWLPEKTEKQINLMVKKNLAWSHVAYETFDTDGMAGNVLKQVSIKDFDGMIYPKMLFSNPLATPGIVIRRDLFVTHNDWRFNNKMRYGQDQYLWLNIAPEYEIAALDEVLVRVRMRGTNASLRARVQLRARALIYEFIVVPNQGSDRRISGIGLLGFKLSKAGERILSTFEKKNIDNSILEQISRVLYLIPYLLFKIEFRRLNKNNNKTDDHNEE